MMSDKEYLEKIKNNYKTELQMHETNIAHCKQVINAIDTLLNDNSNLSNKFAEVSKLFLEWDHRLNQMMLQKKDNDANFIKLIVRPKNKENATKKEN